MAQEYSNGHKPADAYADYIDELTRRIDRQYFAENATHVQLREKRTLPVPSQKELQHLLTAHLLEVATSDPMKQALHRLLYACRQAEPNRGTDAGYGTFDKRHVGMAIEMASNALNGNKPIFSEIPSLPDAQQANFLNAANVVSRWIQKDFARGAESQLSITYAAITGKSLFAPKLSHTAQ